MKKQRTLTTLIITVLIIIVAYFAYTRYVKPIYFDNPKQSLEVILGTEQIITLERLDNQKDIYSIEIELSGNATANLSVFISDNDSIPEKQISLKKGTIDHLYISDWYSDKCYLTISGGTFGKLKVEYRFLGLN